MPIRISEDLPAFSKLSQENIFVISNQRADTQDIRPLRILFLNLMPTKIVTETQILRLLSNTSLQVDVDFLTVKTHTSKNTPKSHMDTFYKVYDDIKEEYYDGLIVTGAPVEQLDFETVDYWDELCGIFEWSKSHIFSTMHICWGAMAGLYYHYKIPKFTLKEKLSGVFCHEILSANIKLFKGFDDKFYAPHSRYTTVNAEDIEKIPNLRIIASSETAGVNIVKSKNYRQLFITGHCEYDRDTLALEYNRDIEKGLDINPPHGYFPENNPSLQPVFNWSAHANLLFSNWLNYCVYQATPFDIRTIQTI